MVSEAVYFVSDVDGSIPRCKCALPLLARVPHSASLTLSKFSTSLSLEHRRCDERVRRYSTGTAKGVNDTFESLDKDTAKRSLTAAILAYAQHTRLIVCSVVD